MTNDLYEVAEKAAKYEIMQQLFEAGFFDIEGASSFNQVDDFISTRPMFQTKVKSWVDKIEVSCDEVSV